MSELRHEGFIGEGTVYLARLGRGEDNKFYEIGNTTDFDLKVENEVKERISKMRGSYGSALDTVILPKKAELKMTIDSFNAENLAIVFMGALSKEEMREETINDELVTVNANNEWLALKNKYLQQDNITVKKAKGDELINAEHYEIHHRLGFIKLKDTARVNAGDKIKVSYKTANWEAWTIPANTETSIDCRIILDGRNRISGQDIKVEIPKATLSPDGGFNFFSNDFNELKIQGTPQVIDGQAPFTVTLKK